LVEGGFCGYKAALLGAPASSESHAAHRAPLNIAILRRRRQHHRSRCRPRNEDYLDQPPVGSAPDYLPAQNGTRMNCELV